MSLALIRAMLGLIGFGLMFSGQPWVGVGAIIGAMVL